MKKIAIIAPNKEYFGATIVMFPFFQSLRQAYPDAEICVWSPVKATSLLQTYSLVDKVIEIKNLPQYIFSLLKFSPDLIINMRPFSLKSELITRFIPAKKKIKFSHKKNKIDVYHDTQIYIAYKYLKLLEPLKIKIDWSFSLFSSLISSSSLKVDHLRKNIVFIVAAGEEYKRWGIDKFLELAKILGLNHFHFHFVLGMKEKEYLPIIQNAKLPHFSLHEQKSLEDLGKLFQLSDLVVSNDCGPSHIAQLSRCSYVGLWGWYRVPLFSRLGEWFCPHENSFALLSDYEKPLCDLLPEKVSILCLGILNKKFNKTAGQGYLMEENNLASPSPSL